MSRGLTHSLGSIDLAIVRAQLAVPPEWNPRPKDTRRLS
jgi:hypothetical protein